MPVRLFPLIVLLSALVVCFPFFDYAIEPSRPAAKAPDYPAPRYPKVERITSVEQMLPNAREIIARKGQGVMRPGYNIRGGEKVLIAVPSYTDPLVIEAFVRAFREKDCIVDVLLLQRWPMELLRERIFDNSEVTEALLKRGQVREAILSPRDTGDWVGQIAKGYDLVVGRDELPNGRRMMWPTREILAGRDISYPEEILWAIDRKGWEIIRRAREVRITDPEGTDLKFTYFPEYWEVVEGIHPTIKTKGGGPGTARGEGYTYRAGASENPLIPGHWMGVAEGIVLPHSDAEGVVMATTSHKGAFPLIRLEIKKHRIVIELFINNRYISTTIISMVSQRRKCKTKAVAES